MSSTKFNIGLAGDEKKSTRVQKIQGGHSDIFGIKDQQAAATPQKRLNQPQSTIGTCFMDDQKRGFDVEPEVETLKDMPLAKVEIEEVDVGTDENRIPKEVKEKENGTNEKKVPLENKDEKKEQDPVAKRVRVPPGGFCTRLW